MWNRFPEDVKRAKALGLRMLRFRSLVPDRAVEGAFDDAALDRYVEWCVHCWQTVSS